MVVWYKVKWIDPFFDALNRVFPNRTKGSDGTIGDAAHQTEVSGHNPDDTDGVRAEREDADTKPEVRAADATNDLHDPAGRTMWDVVHAILAHPADRDRLIYMICNGKIWRKSNSWREEVYTGSDLHWGHGHFSGDPASDENGAPWESILAMGDDMTLDAREKEILENVNHLLEAITQLSPSIPLKNNGVTVSWPNPLATLLKAESADIDELQARPAVTLTAEQIDSIADKISAAVVADGSNALTTGDLDNVKATVKAALREGTE